MNISRTALIISEMQNDYLHADGAYGRADIHLPYSRAIIEQLIKVTNAMREGGGKIISLNFTFICDHHNKPVISDELQQDYPFLTRGDFQAGRWGHQLIEELAPADYVINKVTPSGFYLTHLEWLLQQLKIETLIFGGLMTNEGISLTVREAQCRNYRTVLLEDGCSSFSRTSHQAGLEALTHVTELANCAKIGSRIQELTW